MEIKTFLNKGKLKVSAGSRPTLKKWLKKFAKQKRSYKSRNFRIRGKKKIGKKTKIWINTMYFPTPLEFSKLV